jgi:hypothetical protein
MTGADLERLHVAGQDPKSLRLPIFRRDRAR